MEHDLLGLAALERIDHPSKMFGAVDEHSFGRLEVLIQVPDPGL